MALKNFKIPFDVHGNMLSDARRAAKLEDNYVFEEVLTYQNSFQYSSESTKVFFKDSKGKQYPMFLMEFDDAMQSGRFNGKEIKGHWGFVKKGTRLGIKLVG
jgi:hypothetical protein